MTSILWRRFSVVLLFMGLVLSNESDAKPTDYKRNIPCLEEYCLDCHSNDKAEADINFDDFRSIKDIKKEPEGLDQGRQDALIKTNASRSSQPPDDDRKLLSGWVQSFLMDDTLEQVILEELFFYVGLVMMNIIIPIMT